MKRLKEIEIRNDLSLLDAAWENQETFVLLPEKSSPNDGWLSAALDQVPTDCRKNHFILLTSGSTGQPKLIVGLKKRAERLTEVLHEAQNSEPVRETILVLPLSYSYAFINQWMWAKHHNRKLHVTDGLSNPAQLKETFTNAQNAKLCLVGPLVSILLQHFPNASFPGIIRLHFAGGQFPQQRLADLNRMFPNAEIFNNYGCAEAMPRLTIRRALDANDASVIGRPIEGVRLKTDKTQSLFFQSPYSAIGFVDENGFSEVTEESWTPTGDLAQQIETGDWKLLGRNNEVFKRFGEKISLPEILKSVSSSHTGTAACYLEQDSMGEQGYVLVLSPTLEKPELREVLLGFRKGFPRTHWPLRIEGIQAMPMLSNGKIDAKLLRCNTEKSSEKNSENKTTQQELWRQRI